MFSLGRKQGGRSASGPSVLPPLARRMLGVWITRQAQGFLGTVSYSSVLGEGVLILQTRTLRGGEVKGLAQAAQLVSENKGFGPSSVCLESPGSCRCSLCLTGTPGASVLGINHCSGAG